MAGKQIYGDIPGRSGEERPGRSKAWIYYTVLAVASFLAVCGGQFVGLAGMLLFGLYARYLFRGGSFVLWFW